MARVNVIKKINCLTALRYKYLFDPGKFTWCRTLCQSIYQSQCSSVQKKFQMQFSPFKSLWWWQTPQI